MIIIKSTEEIKKMREAGKILANISEEIYQEVKPGVTTAELDEKAIALCKENSVEPAFLGYNDYPNTICVGVDDIAIHGIPSNEEVLEEGQLISVDMGIIHKGYYSDKAATIAVGKIDSEAERLLEITKLALKASIKQAAVGNRIGDIGYVMNNAVELAGFSVIRDMVGHGIGKNLHEEPPVPCFGNPGEGVLLKEGMVIAIEAMVNEGGSELIYEDDGWTTRTKDGKRSAIFENTVHITQKGPEILTIK